jgi:SnoaL-like domain
MISSILFHPLSTFAAGIAVALAVVAIFLSANAPPNQSAEFVATYRHEMAKADNLGPAADSPAETAALKRFTTFLQKIGSKDFIHENTSKTYASGAYLNDTLVTHHGAAEIEAYFLKTSETMTQYEVTIDDVIRSGQDHYIRWTMVLSAPALAHGELVHSVGISQVRFDAEGKVLFHQDFWDSGENFFGKLPAAGGILGFIRKRLQ